MITKTLKVGDYIWIAPPNDYDELQTIAFILSEKDKHHFNVRTLEKEDGELIWTLFSDYRKLHHRCRLATDSEVVAYRLLGRL